MSISNNILDYQQIEHLCFEFGIEVEFHAKDKDRVEDEYAFELAANRPDLLCVEGLTLALGIYLGLKKQPQYKIVNKGVKREVMVVKADTKKIRPYVVCALLRGVKIDQQTYNSFIDLQDKLHHNLCRRRTLVAIGTHDYDTLKGPFLYDARAPKDIKFRPLNKEEEMDGNRLMEV